MIENYIERELREQLAERTTSAIRRVFEDDKIREAFMWSRGYYRPDMFAIEVDALMRRYGTRSPRHAIVRAVSDAALARPEATPQVHYPDVPVGLMKLVPDEDARRVVDRRSDRPYLGQVLRLATDERLAAEEREALGAYVEIHSD
jgi:hypothetical protein